MWLCFAKDRGIYMLPIGKQAWQYHKLPSTTKFSAPSSFEVLSQISFREHKRMPDENSLDCSYLQPFLICHPWLILNGAIGKWGGTEKKKTQETRSLNKVEDDLKNHGPSWR